MNFSQYNDSLQSEQNLRDKLITKLKLTNGRLPIQKLNSTVLATFYGIQLSSKSKTGCPMSPYKLKLPR